MQAVAGAGRRRWATPEQEATILKHRKAGLNLRRIAVAVGVSPTTVRTATSEQETRQRKTRKAAAREIGRSGIGRRSGC